MSRRRSKTEVTMFPFLSVLCSVIGVLVLFVVLILSTRVVEEENRFQATQAHEREVHAGRPDDVPEEGIDESAYQDLEAELERLTQQIQQRKAERDALVRKLAALQDLLEFKKTEFLLPVQSSIVREFDKPQAVNMVPQPLALVPGEGKPPQLRPRLIEVTSSGYTIQPDNKSYKAIKSETKKGSFTESFVAEIGLKNFLRGIDRRKNKEYLVFLIHPNGVESFQAIRQYLARNHKEVQMGWEPFTRNWFVARDPD